MQKPKIFISSTIYDFKDLRSALKFYLEEQGCTVLASEYSDFANAFNLHSYETCLNAIDYCDYYILLIGARVGGLYSKEENISITHKEYRHAYELHKQGKIKIICFVRSSVWQAKEEHKELVSLLEQLDFEEACKNALINRKSKFIEDASRIIDFINEVSRASETKDAIRIGSNLPTANWIYEFKDFREIVDVLQVNIFQSSSIDTKAEKRLLRNELNDTLKSTLVKVKGQWISPKAEIDAFKCKHPIDDSNKLNETIDIIATDFDIIAWFGFHLFSVKLRSKAISKCLLSNLLLNYNNTTGQIEETDTYIALSKLQKEIDKFNEFNTTEIISIIYTNPPKCRESNTSTFKTISLISYLNLMERWANIIILCKYIIAKLDGNDIDYPRLQEDSPVKGMHSAINEGKPTDSDIDKFVKNEQ